MDIWNEVTTRISVTRTFERGVKILVERASITKRDSFRGERERERQRETVTERQWQRGRDRERQRQRETERERKRNGREWVSEQNGRSRFKVFLEIPFSKTLQKSLKNTSKVFFKDFRRFKKSDFRKFKCTSNYRKRYFWTFKKGIFGKGTSEKYFSVTTSQQGRDGWIADSWGLWHFIQIT